MSNRLPAFGVILLVALLALYSSVFVLNPRQQAIVSRFGEIIAIENEPGIYFKMPFTFAGMDNLQIIESRILRLDLDNLSVQVSGGKRYNVDAFLAYRVSDLKTFRTATRGSLMQAESLLRTKFEDALRQVYGNRGFEAALSNERAVMMREVRDQLRPYAGELGLSVEDVRIRRTDLSDEVSKQTYARMNAERQAEAERLRAQGVVKKEEIRANADRQAVEMLASARKEAEVLKGQAEAQRASLWADAASGKDQQFVMLFNALRSYEKAFQDGGARLILSENFSDFLRYFKGPEIGAPMRSPAPLTAPGAPSGEAPSDATRAVSPEAPAGQTTPGATTGAVQ